jgi:capsular exopolysaccharide synthesis family protein
MDVQAATGLPVLGLIPRIRRAGDWVAPLRGAARAARRLSPGFGSLRLEDSTANGNGVTGSHGNLPVPLRTGVDVLHIAEAYNRLAINLAFANPEGSVRTLVVTSPLPGDGKTTVAVNLAVTLAQRGRSVLIIDADLRRGKIHTLLQSPREPGLSEVLLGTVPFSAAVRHVEVGDSGVLHFLTTGKLPPNAAQLHSSTQARKLLDWLKNEYDLIILDSPPLNVVSDAALLGTNSDGVVIVARAGVTAAGALGFAMEQLQNVRARVLGTVLNDISFKRDVHYDATYEYYGQDVAYYTESRP